jgi:hypothetical protein
MACVTMPGRAFRLELRGEEVGRVQVAQRDAGREFGRYRGREAGPVPAVREAEHALVYRHEIELQAIPEPSERRCVVLHGLFEAACRQQRLQRVIARERGDFDDRVHVFGGSHPGRRRICQQQPGRTAADEYHAFAQRPEGQRHRTQEFEVGVNHGA